MADPFVDSFPMTRGDKFFIPYVVKDQQDSPAVVNITGALIEWTLAKQDPNAFPTTRPQPQKNSTVKEKATDTSGVTITDAANGAFKIEIDSADTVGLLAPGEYYHEVQMTLGTDVTTLVHGIITLNRDIVAPGP
jgi:hypothetical protein